MGTFALTRVFLIALAAFGAIARADGANETSGGRPRQTCASIEPVAPFDLESYTSREWYVLQQSTTWYQPKRNLFCVRANYTLVSDTEIEIWNTANRGGVDGAPTSSRMRLRGVVEDPSDPAKILVGPKFLPKRLYGPYWVVATDTTPGTPEFAAKGYTWAIITGGPLTRLKSDGSCEPSGGFWLFHRDPLASEEVIDEMRSKAQSLGIDTSVLLPVAQAGCTYPR